MARLLLLLLASICFGQEETSDTDAFVRSIFVEDFTSAAVEQELTSSSLSFAQTDKPTEDPREMEMLVRLLAFRKDFEARMKTMAGINAEIIAAHKLCKDSYCTSRLSWRMWREVLPLRNRFKAYLKAFNASFTDNCKVTIEKEKVCYDCVDITFFFGQNLVLAEKCTSVYNGVYGRLAQASQSAVPYTAADRGVGIAQITVCSVIIVASVMVAVLAFVWGVARDKRVDLFVCALVFLSAGAKFCENGIQSDIFGEFALDQAALVAQVGD
jgi:hypothetical protein